MRAIVFIQAGFFFTLLTVMIVVGSCDSHPLRPTPSIEGTWRAIDGTAFMLVWGDSLVEYYPNTAIKDFPSKAYTFDGRTLCIDGACAPAVLDEPYLNQDKRTWVRTSFPGHHGDGHSCWQEVE